MIEDKSQPKVSRRTFLKASAITMASIIAGQTFTSKKYLVPATSDKSAPIQNNETWLHGTCKMCMKGDCINRVKVVNGVVVDIEGEPTSPTNQGRLCPRGLSAGFYLYNPYRVKTPLKRTNPEKGTGIDPKWVEITWDEAFTIVAEKLKAAQAYDPRSLIVNTGFGQMEALLTRNFMGVFGTPNGISSNGPLCAVHYATALTQGNGPTASVDAGLCNYHITIGRSAGPNFGVANGGAKRIVDAVQRGMKLVVVDPRSSAEARLGEWVPIRPGTDLAFTLGMINVILYELQTFDIAFIKNRTNAPYLIDGEGNYVRDSATQKPLMWDATANQSKPFDDPSNTDPSLEGEYTVNEITCHPSFQLIKERVKDYTPEWQEELTTVPAATVRRLAKEFVEAAQIGSTIDIDGFTFPFRPSCVIAERGAIAHRNGSLLDLSTKILNMLIGSFDVPGGCLGGAARAPVLVPDENGTVTPSGESRGVQWSFPPSQIDMATFYPNKHTAPHLTYKAIADPETYYIPYDVQVLWGFGGNSIRSTAGPEILTKSIASIPFMFTIAYNFDEMVELSDVVLPEHSMLERVSVASYSLDYDNVDRELLGLNFVSARDPMPPMYNTKHGDEITIELADRIGLLKGEKGLIASFNNGLKEEFLLDINKRWTIEELIEARIKSLLGPDASLASVQEKGFIAKTQSAKMGYNYFYFPDSQTRHPFYFEHLQAVGRQLEANCKEAGVTVPNRDMNEVMKLYEPIPHWVPNAEFENPGEYDLFAFNWKTPFIMFGLGANHENPWMDEITEQTDPYSRTVCINRATAAKKGIQDGEMVWVESRHGKTQGKAKVSDLFHPEAVGIAGCYGSATMHMNPIAKKGPHYNSLISMEDDSFDPIAGSVETAPRVKVYKV
jgi:anaerobic selenocysteine-containing dehydrogenase